MFDFNSYQMGTLSANYHSGNIHGHNYNIAINLFKSAVFRGKVSRTRNQILGRHISLYDLETIKSAVSVLGIFYTGIKVVDIKDIIGTEGRIADFDMNFYPMDERTRERWINIALANITRIPLPPIKVTQIADKYFVQDGHHRISVARVLGQTAMDAEVVTWKIHSHLPWQNNFQFQSIQSIR